jgi:hypothetical protein
MAVSSAGTPEETRCRATFLKAQLLGFAPTVLAQGWMDQTTVEAVVAEIDAWTERPDRLYVETFCEALGWVSDRGWIGC